MLYVILCYSLGFGLGRMWGECGLWGKNGQRKGNGSARTPQPAAAAEPSTAMVDVSPAADSSVRTGADSSVRTADSSVEAAILFESLLTEVGTPDCTWLHLIANVCMQVGALAGELSPQHEIAPNCM